MLTRLGQMIGQGCTKLDWGGSAKQGDITCTAYQQDDIFFEHFLSLNAYCLALYLQCCYLPPKEPYIGPHRRQT